MRTLHEPIHAFEVLACDQRPQVDRLVARVPLAKGAGALQEPLDERVDGGVLDQQSGAGQADLSGIVVLPEGLCDGGVQIGVGEDEERRLPSQLEAQRRQVRGGRRRDELPGVDRAREGDAIHVGVRRQRRPGFFADALHDIEHAVGHACFVRDVGQQGGGQRCPLGRFEDHGVAGGERRREAPRAEHQRRVPRRDDGGDAGRIPRNVVGVAPRVEVLVRQRDELVGEEVEIVAGPGHDRALHGAQERAVVARLDGGKLEGALLDALTHGMENRCAVFRR